MHLYPEDIKSLLEFDKVCDLLASYCVGVSAKERVQNMGFFNNPIKLDSILSEIEEFKASLEQGLHMSIYAYESIKADIHLLKKEGYVLDIESIFRIQTIISLSQNLVQALSAEYALAFPLLTAIIRQIDIDKHLAEAVGRIFDEDGKVKPSASPELSRIYRSIRSKERELNNLFADKMKSLKKAGFLTENGETVKNGRRVLSIAVEQKRKVQGIIHDESASGKTVYLEPKEVVLVNNQLFELELKRKQEIYKIVKKLCDTLRPYSEDLELWEKVIIRLDVIQAKAKFAQSYLGVKPGILKNTEFEVYTAFHPLLFLKNSKLNLKTVPFDLHLDKQASMLLISGPNAGGKSITLKTVGLIVLMLHAGLLVPVDPRSKIGIFQSVFADIGDPQSVDDDLSTYSGHLQRMKYTLEKSNQRSLILIDEFGSGTDPKIGGSLAEAFLQAFKKKNAFAVMTTHYSNLKMYAHKTRGILNGAMLFDKQELKPSYKLILGKPGSSFAYEIAEKIGLDKHILDYAKNKTGKDNKAVDKLLVDLVEDKKEIEKKMAKILQQEDSLKKLIKNYEQMHKELEIRRKKVKLQSKESQLVGTNNADRELQKVIKEIREKQDLESAKKLSSNLRSKKKELDKDIDPIREEIFYSQKMDLTGLKPGDFVKIKSGGTVAEVLSIKKSKVELLMGSIKMTVKLNELLPASTPIDVNPRKSVRKDLVNSGVSETKLDIRGYLPSDALDFIQEFMDTALINNQSRLEIVHGIGTGKLRKVVKSKLKEYKDIKKTYHPEEQLGGEGVTIVEM